MRLFTADAVAVLAYLADKLPHKSNSNSLISAGTETMSLRGSGKGVVGIASKAISNPDLVHKAIEMVKREGLSKTIMDIKGQKGKMSTLGYSTSGVVLEGK